jgi:hypothetical protein
MNASGTAGRMLVGLTVLALLGGAEGRARELAATMNRALA